MLAVFTGNGKGKTTAALGHVVRALGYGKRAIIFQFIKGNWVCGEHRFVENFPPRRGKFQIQRGGKGFVGILGDTTPRAVHKKAALSTLAAAAEAITSKKWDVVVLDEVNVALSLKLLSITRVFQALKQIPDGKIVICTGRGAPQKLMDKADLVTEMREIKHPYQKGISAREGFDY